MSAYPGFPLLRESRKERVLRVKIVPLEPFDPAVRSDLGRCDYVAALGLRAFFMRPERAKRSARPFPFGYDERRSLVFPVSSSNWPDDNHLRSELNSNPGTLWPAHVTDEQSSGSH